MQTYSTHNGHKTTNIHQQKKHVSQLTDMEKELITHQLITHTFLQTLTISEHLQEKILFGEVDLIEPMIDSIIDHPETSLIEYSRLHKENRVLLRSPLNYPMFINGSLHKTSLCIVINLNTSEIVTAYFNKTNDQHDNLHTEDYDAYLTVKVN